MARIRGEGSIAAGSLVCRRTAAHSSLLSKVKHGVQRIIHFATSESTRRSQVDARAHRTLAQLGQGKSDELWLILDDSDLRKRYTCEMPDLRRVRHLDSKLVPGYRAPPSWA